MQKINVIEKSAKAPTLYFSSCWLTLYSIGKSQCSNVMSKSGYENHRSVPASYSIRRSFFNRLLNEAWLQKNRIRVVI